MAFKWGERNSEEQASEQNSAGIQISQLCCPELWEMVETLGWGGDSTKKKKKKFYFEDYKTCATTGLPFPAIQGSVVGVRVREGGREGKRETWWWQGKGVR